MPTREERGLARINKQIRELRILKEVLEEKIEQNNLNIEKSFRLRDGSVTRKLFINRNEVLWNTVREVEIRIRRLQNEINRLGSIYFYEAYIIHY